MSAGARFNVKTIGHGAEIAWAKLPATLPAPRGIIAIDSSGVTFNRFVVEYETVEAWVLQHDILFCHSCKKAVHEKPVESGCTCGGIVCLGCWAKDLGCPSGKYGGK